MSRIQIPRKPKRKILIQSPRPPHARHKHPLVRLRPTRVVFWCVAGQESSFLGKKTFDALLQKKGVHKRFKVDYEGFFGRTKPEIEKILQNADYVVPMFHFIAPLLRRSVRKLRKQPVVLDVGFDTIHDQYNRHKYEEVFRLIQRIPAHSIHIPLGTKRYPPLKKIRKNTRMPKVPPTK
ncbi:MAG: hypothetical protein J4215_00435 [Candidatus Diapherotrites archaeon]|uniref:Uncharacterized protein n=1 Tax=Candidatus Iainarchaeum sp. TaxID=3101447 RepID=A0A8T4L653_9ARCH|nr:hypothetical protein [Candidatus Diapherotrites archaeon]